MNFGNQTKLQKESRDLFVRILRCNQRLFFFLKIDRLQNARGSSLDVTFEATTPMPPTRMADADAVAAVAAALAKDDEPVGQATERITARTTDWQNDRPTD